MSNCRKLILKLGATESRDCFSTATVADENGKKFILQNLSDKPICKVKVDGCLIASDQLKKCDYMFHVEGNPDKYYLVELKGSDVTTAVEQITSTFTWLNAKLKSEPENFSGVIVSTAVPKAEQKFRIAQQNAYKKYHLMIKKSSRQHSEKA